MKKFSVVSLGIVSAIGSSADEFRAYVRGEVNIKSITLPLSFDIFADPSKMRRVSRYSKLCVSSAVQAVNSYPKLLEKTVPEKIGTIISTGYGAVENNIAFCKSVAKKNPALCSPTVFAGTVPNSCIGQVCIVLGLKGVSTVLIGGNPFEYTDLLLKSKKADYILCGSIEEYTSDLRDSLKYNPISKDIEISEGSVIFCTAYLDENDETDYYCRISEMSVVSLDDFPLIKELPYQDSVERMRDAITGLKLKSAPDIIFSSANGSYFDLYENDALKLVGDNIPIINPKKILGETLGASFSMNAALAAVCIKENTLPEQLTCNLKFENEMQDIQSILVTGYDPAGNYCCVLMER